MENHTSAKYYFAVHLRCLHHESLIGSVELLCDGPHYCAGIFRRARRCCGFSYGKSIVSAAAVLDLSAPFTYSSLAYTILKIAGASYLIYLGLGYFGTRFLNKNDEQGSESEATKQKELVELAAQKIFVQSVIIEASTPKTALFYLALLP